MLTDLKVPSLPCKCAFYRQEHKAEERHMELNFEGIDIGK